MVIALELTPVFAVDRSIFSSSANTAKVSVSSTVSITVNENIDLTNPLVKNQQFVTVSSNSNIPVILSVSGTDWTSTGVNAPMSTLFGDFPENIQQIVVDNLETTIPGENMNQPISLYMQIPIGSNRNKYNAMMINPA